MTDAIWQRMIDAAQRDGIPVLRVDIPVDVRHQVDVQLSNRMVYRMPLVDALVNGPDPEGDFVKLLRAKLPVPWRATP